MSIHIYSTRGINETWDNELKNQQVADNNERYARVSKDQKAVHDEMAQVMENARRENAKKQLALANDISSAMAFSNGGVIPEPLRNLINRRHGFDGRTTGILPSSGFTSGGNFDLIIGNGVDKNGNIVTSRQSFDPVSQYMMMGTNRAAFTDEDRARMRERLSKQYGYSDKELEGLDRGFMQAALNSGKGGGSGGAGLEIAKINADQRAKELEFRQQKQAEDAAFRQQKHETDNEFRNKKFQFDVSKAMAKEAKEFFSSMSDEDKTAFSSKYPELAKSILGISDKATIKPGYNDNEDFVELSREEFAKLSDEEKENYKNRWKAWKQSQMK